MPDTAARESTRWARWRRLGRPRFRWIAFGMVMVVAIAGILTIDVINHRNAPEPVTASAEANGETPLTPVSDDVVEETAEADLPGDISYRVEAATQAAAERGSQMSILIVDRVSGETVGNGDDTPVASASISKLFIADDLLSRDGSDITLSEDDREMLDVMLNRRTTPPPRCCGIPTAAPTSSIGWPSATT